LRKFLSELESVQKRYAEFLAKRGGKIYNYVNRRSNRNRNIQISDSDRDVYEDNRAPQAESIVIIIHLSHQHHLKETL